MSGIALETQILALLLDAPKMTDANGNPDPTQSPAVQCAVVLRNGPMIQGALSLVHYQQTDTYGRQMTLLRLLQINQNPQGGQPQAVEMFFEFGDVVFVAVEREVKASGPTLFSA